MIQMDCYQTYSMMTPNDLNKQMQYKIVQRVLLKGRLHVVDWSTIENRVTRQSEEDPELLQKIVDGCRPLTRLRFTETDWGVG